MNYSKKIAQLAAGVVMGLGLIGCENSSQQEPDRKSVV